MNSRDWLGLSSVRAFCCELCSLPSSELGFALVEELCISGAVSMRDLRLLAPSAQELPCQASWGWSGYRWSGLCCKPDVQGRASTVVPYSEAASYWKSESVNFECLTPLQNKCIHLFHFEGLTLAEIAQRVRKRKIMKTITQMSNSTTAAERA